MVLGIQNLYPFDNHWGAQPQPYGQPEGAALLYSVRGKALIIEERRPICSQTIFIKEKFNEKVGQQPAVFTRLKTASGRQWEELTWTAGGLVFGVYGDIGKSELIKVAESL